LPQAAEAAPFQKQNQNQSFSANCLIRAFDVARSNAAYSLREKLSIGFVLKGRGFSRAVSATRAIRL
jgi:hypothetical protein